MKIVKYLLGSVLVAAFTLSCNKGIDPITEVSPRPDQSAPELNITFPVEGKIVRSSDEVATVTFKLLATDDIEIQSVVIQLDGIEIANLNSFKDYRRAKIDYVYNGLTDGDHVLTSTVTDLTGKTNSKTVHFKKVTAPTYTPLDGEVLYLPFEDNYLDLITGNSATVVGSSTFAEGKIGNAYSGAADAYVTYPTDGIVGDEFSLAFWYKVNSTPDRGGLISISPTGESRNSGFRFLREGSATEQNLGINFGIGETEVWMNPFFTFAVEAQWMHIAISISTTKATIYIDGQMIIEQEIDAPISWTGCSSMTIASGAPNFTYWEHFSDQSLFDELHVFKRAITATEVQAFIGTK
jgi:hypothetical protein